MNGGDDLRLREAQQVIVAAQIAAPLLESLAAKLLFAETMALNHGAHGAVENHQALREQRREGAYLRWR